MKAEQLDVTVGAPSTFKGNTTGLMGVFNDDPTDDLLPPGENAAPLSNRSSEKTIFKEFGERCTSYCCFRVCLFKHACIYILFVICDMRVHVCGVLGSVCMFYLTI